MEISVKLELTDSQYAEFQKSVEGAVDKIMKEESFKDAIAKICVQAIADFVHSSRGKELAKKAVTEYAYYKGTTYKSNFATFMVEKASEEFFEQAKGPFVDAYLEALSDSKNIARIMDRVLIENMSKAMTQACQKKIESLDEVSIMNTGRIDSLTNEIQRITNNGNCF